MIDRTVSGIKVKAVKKYFSSARRPLATSELKPFMRDKQAWIKFANEVMDACDEEGIEV